MTISDGSGEVLDETVLAGLLGHHTKDVFESVFAFTLDELHSDELLKDDKVNNQIYSAGMGVVRLPVALKEIEGRKVGIFLKGGSKHKIAGIANDLKDIESSLQSVANSAAKFGNLRDRLDCIEKESKRVAIQREEIRSRIQCQRQLKDGWDDWNDLVAGETMLAETENITAFPVDGLSRLQALEERIRSAQREYNAAIERVNAIQSAASMEIDHEAILEHSATVTKLLQGRERIESALRDLPKRETQLLERKGLLRETLGDLGPDWDEVRLEEFDFSVAVREEISSIGERIREANRALDEHKAEVARNRVTLREAMEVESAVESDLSRAEAPDLGVDQLRRQRTSVRTAQLQLGKMSEIRSRINDLKDQLNSLGSPTARAVLGTTQKVVVLLGTVLIVGALLGGVFLGESSLTWNGIAALAIVSIVVYVLASRLGSGAESESPLAGPIRESLRRSEAELKDHQSALEESKAILGLKTLDEPSLITAEESLDKQQELIHERDNLSRALHNARESAKKRQSRLEQCERDFESATAQYEAVIQEWQGWLKARGLREAWNPQTVEEIRRAVELGRDRLREVRDWRQRVAAIQQSIREYRGDAEPLASKFGISFAEGQLNSVVAAADRLVELHGEVEKRVRDRTSAAAELEKSKHGLEERKRELEAADREKRELLSSGGAADVEEFREREAACQQRRNLEVKRSELLNRLQKISGPGERLEALKRSLQETSIQAITDEVRQLEGQLGEIDDRITELATDRGSIEKELQNLTSEEKSSGLRAKYGVLREQLREHAREWAKRTVAERLLDEARSTFERERQPGVVRNAEVFFKDITGGRYDRVIAPLGQKIIRVSEANGLNKEPSELSRGTREQLFLSLRFGLVQELGQRTETLPVIVDEVLVNFDPKRALRAARAFVQLSSTNQVLVFTCHPTVVKHFQLAAKQLESPDPKVIDIGLAVS